MPWSTKPSVCEQFGLGKETFGKILLPLVNLILGYEHNCGHLSWNGGTSQVREPKHHCLYILTFAFFIPPAPSLSYFLIISFLNSCHILFHHHFLSSHIFKIATYKKMWFLTFWVCFTLFNIIALSSIQFLVSNAIS